VLFSGETSLWKRISRAALAFDSWIDASLYESGQRAREMWRRFSSFMDGFAVAGTARVAADLACEGLTLGLGGAVVVLALAVPAMRETADEDALRNQDLAVTFLDRYGEEIGKRGIRQDDSLKLDDYPDYFLKAVLATEDRRFYEHWGIDPIGTARALSANARASGVVQGGSTITQQLAKNIFLNNERSIERKVKEAFIAIWMETRLTKNQILKLYLDRVYMGGGNFGAAAAAEFYFGKSAKDISLAEAAMLAGLFKAPTRFAPHINLPAARGRANDVLTNMVEANFLTDGQVATARRNPATPLDRKRDFSPDYYLDFAFDQVKRMSLDGKLGHDKVLIVKTSLDAMIQKSAEDAIENSLRQFGKQWGAKQGATVVVDPDGAVRAMVGGRDYGVSQFNRATDALRQPGSSFKPYVYAAALSSMPKLKPTTIVTDSGVCIGDWCPRNYNGGHAGSMPLIVALAKSINTIPVKLSIEIGQALGEKSHVARAAKLGRAKIIETAHKMGLNTPLADTVSLPIGAAEVTVLDHTTAYAVFANGGKKAAPYTALEVRNSRGDVIWQHDRDATKPEQVLSPSVVSDMLTMMKQAVEAGTGRRAILPGVEVVGKTGTTNAYRDAWFVGLTGNYVAAVWMGNDDYQATNRMTGGTLPAQTWHDMMEPVHQGIELKPLPMKREDPAKQVAGRGGAQAQPNVAAAPAPAQGGAVQPGSLSRKSFEVLTGISSLFKKVEEARTGRETTSALPAGNTAAAVQSGGDRLAVP
jgi:penicillin-binding protein 1A